MRDRTPALGAVVVTALAIVAGACGSSTVSPTSPTSPTAPATDLTPTLTRAIQDEYRAETIYQGVVDDFGTVLPFVNVLTAETRHSTSIARLFELRSLAAPGNDFTVEGVPHYSSVAAACAAGVVAERANIAMYDELLRSELPADVRQVFASNRSASLFNHLPAFERCY
jgi:hypothetical protein